MDRLICESHVRAFLKAKAEKLRPGWACKRVSQAALEKIDARVRAMLIKMVKHPTKGQTFTEVQ